MFIDGIRSEVSIWKSCEFSSTAAPFILIIHALVNNNSSIILLQYNVALPPAILSRFDLVYVMIDDPDDQTDYHIAHHIVRVHQKHENALAPAFTTAQLKRYMSYAKTLKPKVCSFPCFVPNASFVLVILFILCLTKCVVCS